MSWVSQFRRRQMLGRKPIAPVGDQLPLVHPTFPIVVCWRPKAACTTLLKWFLFHTGRLEEAAAHSGWLHNYREQVLNTSPGYMELCRESLFGTDRFVVKAIRDPARRAVSGFLHVIRQTSDSNIAPWPDIAAWKRRVGLGDQAGLTFQQFIRYVIDRRQAAHPLDGHVAPQQCPIQDPRVDAFLPIENLADELRNLERRFALPPSPLKKLSESSHHNLPTAGNRWPKQAAHMAVTASMLKSLGTPSADVFLDVETLQLIARGYAEDYEAYGSFYEPRLLMWGPVGPRVDRASMPRFSAEPKQAA